MVEAISTRSARLNLAILLLLVMLSYLDRAVISLIVEPLRHDLGVSDFQISLLQGASFAIFYALCGIPMGWLVDRYPRRLIIFIGMTIWSLSTAAGGLARSFGQLFLFRLGVGAGEAALAPAAYSIIGDTFPRRQMARANSVFTMGTMLGNATALFVGSSVFGWASARGPVTLPIIGTLAPWQLTLILLGLPGFVIGLAVFLLREPPRKASDAFGTGSWADFRRFLGSRSRYFICYIGGFTTLAMIALAAISWMPPFLQRRYGLDIPTIGKLLSAATLVAGVVGYLAAGWVMDRWFASGVKDAHFRCGLIVAGVTGVCGAAAFLVDDLTLAVLLFAVMSAFASVTGVAVAHIQITTPTQYLGRAVALYLFTQAVLAIGLAPSIVGAVTDFVFVDPARVGDSVALTIAVLAPIAATFLAVGLKPAVEAVDVTQRIDDHVTAAI